MGYKKEIKPFSLYTISSMNIIFPIVNVSD